MKNAVRVSAPDLRRDISLSAIVAAFIAVAVSYAGPAVIVFQAAKAGHLSAGQLSSWIWAISIGSGLSGMLLSWRYRMPIITAWSTPGAALLVTSLSQYNYQDVIGAYLFSAALITLFGFTGVFSRLMERIPREIIGAMLAGVLFRFGVSLFGALETMPILVLPVILAYLIGKRFFTRYAVLISLTVGLCIATLMSKVDLSLLSATLARPVFTKPTFSLSAVIGLGVPLFMVTMASQNMPGVAVLKTAGYDAPVSSLVTATGLISLVLAPFGAHAINLAAITAAICTSAEAHPEMQRRYVAGVFCGVFYLLVGAFGSIVASAFSTLPDALIASVAGLALLGALAAGLGSAMTDEGRREPALITFLLTASGAIFFGIGAAFWGLLLGVLTDAILFGNWKRWRLSTNTSAIRVHEVTIQKPVE